MRKLVGLHSSSFSPLSPSSLLSLSSVFLPALLACACSAAPGGGGGNAENTGSVHVALTSVPPAVGCIEIDVTGMTNLTQRFTVTTGASSNFTLAGVPLGAVDVAGSAWNGSCSDVGATPTWTAQSAPATITAGAEATVYLTFFAVTNATVSVDFESETYRTVSTFAGAATQVGTTDGVGAAARFNRPQQLTSDATNLYVPDGKNKTIRRVALATGAVTTLAGNPAATGAGVDGVGAAATFNHPEAAALDGAGNLFVTDSQDNTVRQIVLATGAVTTLAGAAGQVGSDDGTGTAALFSSPYGITADGRGNLFVVDAGNSTIRKIVIATGVVTTFAGVAGQSGSVDGIGSVARFYSPIGITNDGSNLYITDGSTVRFAELSNGKVFTILGTQQTLGTADGFSPAFGMLYGITYDAAGGNVFLTDLQYSDVRQYSLNTGLVTTCAGTAYYGGSADGLGPAASFRLPIGITADPSGNVYVADTSNDTIRKM